jgi:protein-tyrosine phosphatase
MSGDSTSPAAPGARIEFDGPTNFRDLGGYETAAGRIVRRGRVYRSDALYGLDDDDIGRLQALGLRLAFDLRSPRELAAEPGSLRGRTDIEVREVSLIGSAEGERELIERATSSEQGDGVDRLEGERFLREVYSRTVEQSAPLIGGILARLGEPEATPAVVYCAAGKDRTGIVAALLLRALGVPRETVLEDYELTSRYRSERRVAELTEALAGVGIPAALAAGLLDTSRWAMADLLDELEAGSRSVDDFLLGPAGLLPEQLARLRTALLA